jgi:Fe-S cluster assembly protein SufD
MTLTQIQSDYIKHNGAELYLGKEGFPKKNTEGFRFTPLKKMMPEKLVFSTTHQDFTPSTLWNDISIKFSGGKLISSSDSTLFKVEELDKDQFKLEFKNALEALSVLRISKFYKITVPANTKIENLKIENYSDLSSENNFDACCFHVEIGENSSVNLFENTQLKGTDQAFFTTLSLFHIERNASLKHFTMSNASEQVSLVNNRKVFLKESSDYKNINFDGGLGHNRNDIEVVLQEKFANTNLYGLYALKENQFSDNFINVHHQAAETTSNQLFKGILKDKSRAVFTGKVLVDAGANLVNSSQLNKNILLDNTAHVQTEPQLEVYTDDVKCGHGATVGQLSEEEIFYLESRGISKERAFQLLCQAYANEILMNINCSDLKSFFVDKLYGHFDFSSMAKELIESNKK